MRGGEALACYKGYAGAEFERAVAERFAAKVLRPGRADKPDHGLHLSGIRQLVESVFWTLKGRLGLEPREPAGGGCARRPDRRRRRPAPA